MEVSENRLYYARRKEFERIVGLQVPQAEWLALYADLGRLNTLYMIAAAGSGHIGSSFSSLDIVAYLHRCEIDHTGGDLYFSSKGHDAPGLYAVLIAEGVLAEENLHALRRIGGLPGHPDVATPGIVTNTGSLGMGISKAKGIALANRHMGKSGRLFVMTGDGELQEGQIWESLASAANLGLGEITVIVDHNKIQSDYSVERTSSLGDVAAKFAAFGWHVERVDGHDIAALAACFERLRNISDTPKVVIADTVKGKGVSFMEGTSIDSDVDMFKFHSGAPGAADYIRAIKELVDRMNDGLLRLSAEPLRLETVERPAAGAQSGEAARLFPAYTEALIEHAEKNDRLVALDADLVLDMGLIPFAQRFPDRFFECGIAEMDMVSQAGGMALRGLLPVVHSFSCFLSTRPNEQIYNNATEGTKVIYVGGLSGVLPGGPGHSHQSVRDISCIGAVPNLVVVEPSCPQEVAPLLDWCVNRHEGPSFLRMISIPYMLPYGLPADYEIRKGRGATLREGRDVAIIGYGMVTLAESVKAAERLKADGVSVKVVNLPWLNRVDADWLGKTVAGMTLLVTIDNHYVAGGQGDMVMSAVAELGLGLRCRKLGIADVPPSGTNDEVLRAVGLDGNSIAARIAAWLPRN
ncbi:MAG: transketolase C-terminal domain-containing protein [Rhodospirillales bacterium]|jgi:transketolase|nr:transketolase C-terminal domain-containing protein [Rhodospirillales bacterium]